MDPKLKAPDLKGKDPTQHGRNFDGSEKTDMFPDWASSSARISFEVMFC